MKPLDPRLLRYASAARGFLAVSVLLGLVHVALVLVFSWLVARIIATVADAVSGGVPWADSAASVAPELAGLVVVVLVRGGTTWLADVIATRAAVKVKSQLRMQTAQALVRRLQRGGGGPAEEGSAQEAHPVGSAHAVSVLGSGLDALDAYFSRYLPQLVLTALAIPIHLIVLATQDMTTAIIVAVTMPLIPIFMVLIGWTTQSAQARQWQRLDALGRSYLDIVEGLSTLKVFNRAGRQRENVRRITEGHRRSTMKVLRVSFLSGFVLEIAASLSVALVAVSVGIRLIDGGLELFVGLFVLLIVPEAYAPLRQVGANYHAAADGVAAAESVFEILDAAPEPDSPRPHSSGPQLPSELASGLRISGLSVTRSGLDVLHEVDAEFPAGAVSAVVGPSGSGKSSLFAALLGFVPSSGEVELMSAPTDPAAGQLRESIAWSGQYHGLSSGSVLENIALGDAQADRTLAQHLVERIGLSEEGISLETQVGVRGAGLSGGQAHRVAIIRALYRARRRQCPVLLLDEPTAALDARSEHRLMTLLGEEAAQGRAVVVITHRPEILSQAQVILRLHSQQQPRESAAVTS